jgi:Flp pilus assembly protein TadG
MSKARRDRGSLTLMLAVLFPVLLAFAGIVVDGGNELAQRENAAAAAQEAARAGAGMVNQSAAYSSGTFTVDTTQALAAARSYLASAGYSDYSVTATGPETIAVTVTITVPTKVLSIIGIKTMTATGHATASLITGITGAVP